MQLLNSTSSFGEESILSACIQENLSGDESSKSSLILPEDSPFATCSPPGTVVNVGSPAENVPDVSAHEAEEWAAKIQSKLSASVAAIIEVGRLLLDAKKALGHGRYTKMVESSLPFNVRQAQYYTRIARNVVLSNAQNAAYLPRSVNQLCLLARLRDEDLIEIVADVKARLANGEQVNTDSPKFWTAYQEKYGQQSLPKEGEKAAQESLSAGPDQADPPASEVPPHNPPDVEESQEENDSSHCEAEQSSESSDPEMDCAAKSDAHPPCDHESTVAKAAEGEKAMGDADITDKDDGKSEPEKQISPTMQAPASTEAAKCQAQQSAANNDDKVIILPKRDALLIEKNAFLFPEQNSGNILLHLWEDKMVPEWRKHPKKVRIFILKWLLAEEMIEDVQPKAA